MPELTSCPECGHEVSRSAHSCPHCGAVLQLSPVNWLVQTYLRIYGGLFLVGFLLVILGAWYVACWPEPESPEQESDPKSAELLALGDRAAFDSMVAQFVTMTDVYDRQLYIDINEGATILYEGWGCDQQRELMRHLFQKWQEQLPTARLVSLRSYTGREIGRYSTVFGYHCD